jgi:hypothetical protein
LRRKVKAASYASSLQPDLYIMNGERERERERERETVNTASLGLPYRKEFVG